MARTFMEPARKLYLQDLLSTRRTLLLPYEIKSTRESAYLGAVALVYWDPVDSRTGATLQEIDARLRCSANGHSANVTVKSQKCNRISKYT